MISPRNGVFDWSAQYTRGQPHRDCVVSRSKLSTAPTVVDLNLNDFVRFDAAGTYSVAFRTKRVVSGGFRSYEIPRSEIITNQIRLTITEMSEAEEEAETRRLSAAIDAAKGNWGEQTRLAEQLSYLTGTPSTKEKVKRFLTPLADVPGNYAGEIRWGLFIARDRKLAAKLLEAAFRDPMREVGFDLLGTLAMLRSLAEIPDDTPFSDEHYSRVEKSYLAELARSLDGRKGIPRGAAAITILQKLGRENPPSDLLAKVRSILLADFDTYNMFSREYLMSAYWHQLKDPSLVPSLQRMLTEKNYPDYGKLNVNTTAIKRLIELDSQKARPFVIAQIQDVDSLLYDDALDGLEDEVLPEVDESLLEQITRFAKTGGNNRVRLRAKTLMAARYATSGIYEQLLQLYREHSDSFQADSKGILLGYFLKHKPSEGLEMIENALKTTAEEMRGSLLSDATRKTFPAEAASFFEKRLTSDDPLVAGNAAYILSKHGSEKHKPLIQERLDKWVKQWAHRKAELEGAQMKPEYIRHAMLQVELISALLQAKAWRLSASEIQALRAKCLIEQCRPYYPQELNQ